MKRLYVFIFHQPLNDYLTLKTPGIHWIPWKRGFVYTWQTGCSTETRVKEHSQHIYRYHMKNQEWHQILAKKIQKERW